MSKHQKASHITRRRRGKGQVAGRSERAGVDKPKIADESTTIVQLNSRWTVGEIALVAVVLAASIGAVAFFIFAVSSNLILAIVLSIPIGTFAALMLREFWVSNVVEKTMVSGVFVILALILLPIYNQARAKARLANCLKNAKTLPTALRMYATEHDSLLPPASRWSSAIGMKIPRRLEGTGKFSYAFEKSLGGKDIRRVPGDAVLVLESDSQQANATGDLHSLPAKPRHSGGDVYGLLDGTVHRFPREKAASLDWPR